MSTGGDDIVRADHLRRFGRSIEAGVRQIRDGVVDAISGTSHFRRAAHRSFGRQGKLIFCRFEDHDIVVDPNDLVGKTVLAQGNFDRVRTDAIAKRASELAGGVRRTVLEVGANIGTQTIYFLKSGFFDVVVCLEPDPTNVRMLETNLHLNSLTDGVVLLPVAAGDKPGMLRLQRETGNSGGATLRTDKLSEHVGSDIEVPVITLDSLFQNEKVDVGDIGLLWIDAEGFEEEIFKGASIFIEKRTPMVFEFSPGFYSPEKARRIAEFVFLHYDNVSIVDDAKFDKITLSSLLKLKRQADIFCC